MGFRVWGLGLGVANASCDPAVFCGIKVDLGRAASFRGARSQNSLNHQGSQTVSRCRLDQGSRNCNWDPTTATGTPKGILISRAGHRFGIFLHPVPHGCHPIFFHAARKCVHAATYARGRRPWTSKPESSNLEGEGVLRGFGKI